MSSPNLPSPSTSSPAARRAVFLDRDGTLNVDVGYLHELRELRLYPWAVDALRLLERAGYVLVVITNQAGLAQGLIEEGFVEQAHDEMQRRLVAGGTGIAAYYSCPHHPTGSVAKFRADCRCRKPKPGLIEDAVRDLGIDPRASWMIGDKWIDVEVGHAVGARSILVRTGWGSYQEARGAGRRADAVVDNLMAAVSVILDADRSPAG